ncbi:MAG: LysM peptidoglycan-binding domain-containing protein [Thiomargarita sp.]|nr:LysM peptidoglycan-binding domain-containing protein [Thiomargarita sp.]
MFNFLKYLLIISFFSITSHLVQAANKFVIHAEKSDIVVTNLQGRLVFSFETIAKKDFENNFLTDQSLKTNQCQSKRRFTILSTVGNLISFQDQEHIFCQNNQYQSKDEQFLTIDVNKNGEKVKLTDIFTEKSLLKALLTDNLIKNIFKNKKQPSNLSDFYDTLLWSNIVVKACEYYLPQDFLNRFAFHHVKKGRVAIRLELPAIEPTCGSENIKLGFYLSIPKRLKSAFKDANKRKLLMKHPNKKSAKFNFSSTNYIVSEPNEIALSSTNLIDDYTFVTVLAGDSLYGVAKRHGYKMKELAALNNLYPPYALQVGQKLRIKKPIEAPIKNKISDDNIDSTKTNQVIEIKEQNTKTVEKITKLIEIPTPKIEISEVPTENPEYYTVVSGDNLSRIARKYGVSFRTLAVWNRIKSPYGLLIGQKLVVSNPVEKKWNWLLPQVVVFPDLTPFNFKLIGTPTGKNKVEIEKIEISKQNKSEILQTIVIDFPALAAQDLDLGFKVEDINFDGYQDIRLNKNSASELVEFFCWLFDPKTETFVLNYELSQLFALEFDAKKQYISSHLPPEPDYQSVDYYKFADGQLVLIRQVEKQLISDIGEPEKWETTIYELIEDETDNSKTFDTKPQSEELIDNKPVETEKQTKLDNIKQSVSNKHIWVEKADIHASLSEFNFTLIGNLLENSAEANIEQIEIRQIAKDEIIQTIETLVTPLATLNSIEFKVKDINFDGYQDIGIMEFSPMGLNVPFLYWLFEPKTGQFIYSEEFSALTSLAIDAKNQLVKSVLQTNDKQLITTEYKVINNKLVLFQP